MYLQDRRDGAADKRFFKRLLRSHGGEPRKIVTDKLRRYGVEHWEITPETIRSTKQYANNRVEQGHEATRVRERGMRWSASRDSNRPDRQSGFCVFTPLFQIYLILAGIWSRLNTIEISGSVHSTNGVRQLLERRTTNFSGPGKLTCQSPLMYLAD